jgi:hypothetical protein
MNHLNQRRSTNFGSLSSRSIILNPSRSPMSQNGSVAVKLDRFQPYGLLLRGWDSM